MFSQVSYGRQLIRFCSYLALTKMPVCAIFSDIHRRDVPLAFHRGKIHLLRISFYDQSLSNIATTIAYDAL